VLLDPRSRLLEHHRAPIGAHAQREVHVALAGARAVEHGLVPLEPAAGGEEGANPGHIPTLEPRKPGVRAHRVRTERHGAPPGRPHATESNARPLTPSRPAPPGRPGPARRR